MQNLDIQIKSVERVFNGDEVNARAQVIFDEVGRISVTVELAVAGDDDISLRALELALLEKAQKALADLVRVPTAGLYPILQATRLKYDLPVQDHGAEAPEDR